MSNDLSIRIAGMRKDVSVTIEKSRSDRSSLIITGLSPEQMERIIPEINREIFITLIEEKRPLRAKAMRFIREGLWETLIKIIAGLVVGYLLIRFGLK